MYDIVTGHFYTLQRDHLNNSSNYLSPCKLIKYHWLYPLLLFTPSLVVTNPLISIIISLFLFSFVCSFVLMCVCLFVFVWILHIKWNHFYLEVIMLSEVSQGEKDKYLMDITIKYSFIFCDIYGWGIKQNACFLHTHILCL